MTKQNEVVEKVAETIHNCVTCGDSVEQTAKEAIKTYKAGWEYQKLIRRVSRGLDKWNEWMDIASKKQDELEIAAKALEFYAGGEHFDNNDYGGVPPKLVIMDEGETAREALKKIKGK